MKRIYFIADTHFGDDRIRRYENRPFETVAEMEPFYIEPDSAEIKTCINTYNEITGEKAELYTMGGGTYAKHLPNACALGPEDPDYESPFGLFRGSIHQADESTPAKLLFDTMLVYAKLLVELDDIDINK